MCRARGPSRPRRRGFRWRRRRRRKLRDSGKGRRLRLRGGEAPRIGRVVGGDRDRVERPGLQRRARDYHHRTGRAQAPAAVFLGGRVRISVAGRVERAVFDRLAVFGQRMRRESRVHEPPDLQRDGKSHRPCISRTACEWIRCFDSRSNQAPRPRRRVEIPPRAHTALLPRAVAASAAWRPSTRRSKPRRIRRPPGTDRASRGDETALRSNNRSAARRRTSCSPTQSGDCSPRPHRSPSNHSYPASPRMRPHSSAWHCVCHRRNSAAGIAHARRHLHSAWDYR